MNERPRTAMTRRDMLLTAGAVTGGLLASRPSAASPPSASKDFRYCLNTSTIRGQDLSIEEEIDVTAKAGYDAIEPWLGKLQRFVDRGGSADDLRRRIADHGITVESAIGFARWIVDDDADRARGLEQAKRDMDLIARIGGKRIAAPPAGVPGGSTVDPMQAAGRYRELLELGREMGVVPQIEMWGGNRTIGRVSTAIFIAIESGHPDACFLGDVFHTYKGGSSFDSLRLLGPGSLQVYHLNDYPADPPREKIGDDARVYPGDGVAPLATIYRAFREGGAAPVLSLELFNREYWKREALDVARTGLQKMKDSVAAADR